MVDAILDAHLFSRRGFISEVLEPTPFEIYVRGMILPIFVIFGWIVARRERSEQEELRATGELERSIEEVRTLRGIIPICASCKKVRDDAGARYQVEVYVRAHSEADFSHGPCPDCAALAEREIDQYAANRDLVD